MAQSVSFQSMAQSATKMLSMVIGSLITSAKPTLRHRFSAVVSPLIRVSRSPMVERLK